MDVTLKINQILLGPKSMDAKNLVQAFTYILLIVSAHTHTSHTRMVVRECYKYDDASQCGNRKFDPSQRSNSSTDHNQKLHT